MLVVVSQEARVLFVVPRGTLVFVGVSQETGCYFTGDPSVGCCT